MLEERNTLGGMLAPSLGPPATFGEAYDAAVESQRAIRNSYAIGTQSQEAYRARIDAIENATGVRLDDPFMVRDFATRLQMERAGRGDPFGFFDRELARLAEQYPDKRDIIRPDEPPDIAVRQRAQRAERTEADVSARGGNMLGGIAGGFRGMLEDPVNVGMMLLGPWGRVGMGARALAWSAVKNGVANGVAEAAEQPFVQGWRKRAGLDYGASHAALDIAMATVFGGAMDVAVRGAYRGMRRAAGSVPQLDADGGVIRWGSPDAALEHAARTAPATSRVRQAADGDADSLHMIAKESGVADDPAYRGAREAARTESEIGHSRPPDGVPDTDHADAVINALRAMELGEAPPAAPHVVPEARGVVLSDEAPLPGATFRKDGKPVGFQQVRPDTLTADPAIFQFRSGVDARGVTGRLSGVETWDQMAAGKVVVFERANGERVIADGHHRLELARRLRDQQPMLDAYVFREADGWQAEDVAAYAAKKNMIDSPRVDPVDAARVLRQRPDLIDSSLPLRDGTLQVARQLARLSDEAFGMVQGGVVEPGHAALVGQTVRDHTLHAGMLAELVKAEPRSLQEARLLISELMQVPTAMDEQMTLFGLAGHLRPLLRERVQVMDRALATLAADARVFKLLGREASRIEAGGNRLARDANSRRAMEAATVQEVIERLATQPGPLNDWLNEAARAVATGEKPKAMGEALARRVARTLERDGLQGLLTGAEPAGLRIADPAGPEAAAQLESMTRTLAADIDTATKPDEAAAKAAKIAELEQGLLFSTGVRRAAGDAVTRLDEMARQPQYRAPFSLRGVFDRQIMTPGYIEREPFDLNSVVVARRSTETVPVGNIRTIQRTVSVNAVKGKLRNQGDETPPSLFKYGDTYYVNDGNHRVTAARIKNEDRIVAEVIELADAPAAAQRAHSGQDNTTPQRVVAETLDAPGLISPDTDLGMALAAKYAAAEPGELHRTVRAAEDWSKIGDALRETVRMLPRDVRMRVEERLDVYGRQVDGFWHPGERIVYVALSAYDPVRTARHETVHALRQSGLMTDDEFGTLYRFAERAGLREAYQVDARYKQLYDLKFSDRGADYVEALLREETIADMFSDYAANGRRFGSVDGGGPVDRIIGTIVAFMEKLRNALDGLGFRDVRDVFERMESGEMAMRRETSQLAEALSSAERDMHLADSVEACRL